MPGLDGSPRRGWSLLLWGWPQVRAWSGECLGDDRANDLAGQIGGIQMGRRSPGESAREPAQTMASGQHGKEGIGRGREHRTGAVAERDGIEQMHHIEPTPQPSQVDSPGDQALGNIGVAQRCTHGDQQIDRSIELGEQIEGHHSTEGVSDQHQRTRLRGRQHGHARTDLGQYPVAQSGVTDIATRLIQAADEPCR